MKHFWALPAVLRLALASHHTFSVFDDLLAFPQYELHFPDTYLTEDEASSLLSHSTARSTRSAAPDSQETQDLSKSDKPGLDPPTEDAIVEETYEKVVLGGQRYLCSVPVIPEEEVQNSTVTAEEAKVEEEKELVRATDRGWELLEGMHGNCIYYLSGWWSYSFCYKADVKQFHQLPPSRGVPIYPPVEDTSVKSFTLGRYAGAKKISRDEEQKTLGGEHGEVLDDEGNRREETSLIMPRMETKGSSRYMVQRLSGGTECDLTGRDRKIEVQYHCHPQSADKIAMIKEISTCSYLMIIYTPRLCNDVAFLPPQDNLAHPITCTPVLTTDQTDEWTLDDVEAKLHETERLIAEHENTNPLRDLEDGAEGRSRRLPVVGGITVGAQLLVGGPGKEIEKTVVVGGGKETFAGTLIDSEGNQMGKEDLKKLSMDQKDVEKLRKNSQKIAGKKDWRLDIIDTPGGREFRLVVEAEDGQDEPEKEKRKEKRKEKNKRGDANDAEGKKRGMKRDDEQQDQDGHKNEGSEEEYKDEL